jgi:acyl-CoA reductase-like NAD-dependent aldehyde dehydrogenase
LLIHGEWVDAADGAEFDVYNPSTGQVFTRVSEAGPEDVNRAVESSRRAFEEGSWRNMKASAKELVKVCLHIGNRIHKIHVYIYIRGHI